MPVQVEIPQIEAENALDAANHALAWFQAVRIVADMIEEDEDWSEEYKEIAKGVMETLMEAQRMLKAVVDSGMDISDVIMA